MPLSVTDAAEVFRQALRDAVRRHALWYLVQGIILLAAGALAALYPVISSFATVNLLGWLLIVSGLAQGIGLLGARQVPHFWLQLISVALGVLIGLLFLRDPEQSLLTLTLLLIVFFMIEGMSKVIFALTIRPMPNWIWVLASGLAGIVLSGLLWSMLPVTAIWLIGFLLGLHLIGIGAAMSYLAWQIRKTPA